MSILRWSEMLPSSLPFTLQAVQHQKLNKGASVQHDQVQNSTYLDL